SVAVIRLIIAVAVLTALNWRLALAALAIIPGVMVISFIFAKRVRPIYRTVRKDAEQIDGRVGETFSGIRVVRAFRREIHEVFEGLAMPNDKHDRLDARDAPSVVRELCFEDVEFEYREGRPVVSDFSVVAPAGWVIALVGRSGAGKTTVTDLAARFHDPTKGR